MSDDVTYKVGDTVKVIDTSYIDVAEPEAIRVVQANPNMEFTVTQVCTIPLSFRFTDHQCIVVMATDRNLYGYDLHIPSTHLAHVIPYKVEDWNID